MREDHVPPPKPKAERLRTGEWHGSRTATPVLGVLVQPVNRRILIVEDDAVLSQVLTDLLEEHGYLVQSVARGGDAVKAAQESPPALLILDVGLPDTDGLAVAAELGRHPLTAQTPVLFLSGHEDLPARVRLHHTQPCDFLRKPYGQDELLARIERCLAEADARAKLRQDARIDELTGLGNARLLRERMQVESARRARYGTPLTLVVIDVDRLKQINDNHGHPAGSAVLRALGEALRAEIRETDVAFRYGGDEFVVLLPHTTLDEGVTFSERLIARIRGLRPCDIVVSVSIGVAASDDTLDSSAAVQGQLARADAAAYAAKRAGGDRIITDDRSRP
jgi:two-component system cell cycle response regulator